MEKVVRIIGCSLFVGIVLLCAYLMFKDGGVKGLLLNMGSICLTAILGVVITSMIFYKK